MHYKSQLVVLQCTYTGCRIGGGRRCRCLLCFSKQRTDDSRRRTKPITVARAKLQFYLPFSAIYVLVKHSTEHRPHPCVRFSGQSTVGSSSMYLNSPKVVGLAGSSSHLALKPTTQCAVGCQPVTVSPDCNCFLRWVLILSRNCIGESN